MSLREFSARLLEYEGALVDRIEPEGLEVIAPPNVREALHVNEISRLGFSAELPSGAERVSLESDWLERFELMLGDRGRVARAILDVSLPLLSNPERIVEHAFSLENAVHRIGDVVPTWTRYLILVFRVTAFSDEKREGLVKLGFNLATGSTPDAFVGELFRSASEQHAPNGMRLPEAHLTPDWSQGQLKSRVARALPERVHTYLDPFVKGMQRRLERDLARVYDYFSDLGAESVTRQQKLHQSAEMETARDELRLESIAREYKAKVADLQQKYALRVEVNWSQSLEVVMPVRRVEVIAKRRKGERKIKLDWNPLARRLEAPPCEFSYSQSTRRVVCDDKLHIINPEAHAPCANCHKSFCRACHPLQCPKCHKSRC